ncbi:MAG TPA: LytTR family DNA-binding domain-containing protein [Chitinophagaceae bacterium]|nr:LytTR family DNA-binding domain-containing protein [Chitinophagaceae bacterium]
MPLRALLVDDEDHNLNILQFMLQNDCEDVEVAGLAKNAQQAREWLQQNSADVVFLDINMPGENGFQLLSSIAAQNFKVVFVTAHNEFALQAIKASAVDYILKPVSIDELQKAVEKVKRLLSSPAAAEQNQLLVRHLLHAINKKTPPKKIALPQLGSINFIEVDDIVSLQADSNYTIIHMKNMQKQVISKTLKEFEELLDENQFVRIHKSYIVNISYIKEYSTADGGVVKMSDGNQWSISRRQLDFFLAKMRNASLMFGK